MYVKRVTSDGYTVERIYDKAGRLITVIAQDESTVNYTYNANGSRQSAIYEDGTKEEYTSQQITAYEREWFQERKTLQVISMKVEV